MNQVDTPRAPVPHDECSAEGDARSAELTGEELEERIAAYGGCPMPTPPPIPIPYPNIG